MLSRMTPFMGEFVGTALLVLIGDSVVANNCLARTKGNNAGWLAMCAGWGLAVFVAVYCVAASSGAHLNPAVTIGLWCAGVFDGAKVSSYITAQMLGGFVGAVLMWISYLPHWGKTPDGPTKLGVFCNAPAIRAPLSNFVTEVISTGILIFGILSLKDAQLNMNDGSVVKMSLGAIGVLPVALLVFAIGLCLGGSTGYAINPARDFAPRIAHALLPIPNKGSNDWGYSWIPIFGPIAGGALAAWLFKALNAASVVTAG